LVVPTSQSTSIPGVSNILAQEYSYLELFQSILVTLPPLLGPSILFNMGILALVEDRPTPKAVYNWRVYACAAVASFASCMIGYDR